MLGSLSIVCLLLTATLKCSSTKTVRCHFSQTFKKIYRQIC